MVFSDEFEANLIKNFNMLKKICYKILLFAFIPLLFIKI